MWLLFRVLLAALLLLVVRSWTDVVLENVALQHQLEVYDGPAAASPSPTRIGGSGPRSPGRGRAGGPPSSSCIAIRSSVGTAPPGDGAGLGKAAGVARGEVIFDGLEGAKTSSSHRPLVDVMQSTEAGT